MSDYFQKLVSGQQRGLAAGVQRGALRGVSVVYGLGARLRNHCYDRGWKRVKRAAVPVVSVGNLTLGGTGKTPCVEYVARFYREHGRRVAILSRGYVPSPLPLSPGGRGIGVRGRNDEALVLEENLPDVPHLQGADRVALAEIAVAELESEVLVLDDGFQHRRLARDLDLVLVDATNPWGGGYLFPRGLLRESATGLRRAGMVLLTRCDQADEEARGRIKEATARLAPGVPVAETTHQPVALVREGHESAPLDRLREKPVAAFCGIGNPEAFRRTLAGLGAEVAAFRVYPDHHGYTRADVADLRGWARRQATEGLVVTTQKDLVKLRLAQFGGRELWALRIQLQVTTGREELERRLLGCL